MKTPISEIGKYLRKARTDAHLKQAVLAQKIGVTASYISQIETEKDKKPSPEVIRRLAKVLGNKPNDLFRLIDMQEMDFEETVSAKCEEINRLLPDLAKKQVEELANYLAYLEFKISLEDKKKVLITMI